VISTYQEEGHAGVNDDFTEVWIGNLLVLDPKLGQVPSYIWWKSKLSHSPTALRNANQKVSIRWIK